MQWKEDNRGDFENFWKDAFQDEQMSPPEGLWEDIENEVDQINKKKNHFTFLRSIAALITVGLLTSFLVKYEAPHSLSIGDGFDGKNVNTASMISPSLYEADAINNVSVLDKHVLPRIKKVAVNMPPPMMFLGMEEEEHSPEMIQLSYIEPEDELELEEVVEEQVSELGIIKRSKTVPATKKKHKKRYYATAEVGMSRINPNIKMNGQVVSEKTTSPTFGVNAGMQLENGFFVEAGVKYADYTYKTGLTELGELNQKVVSVPVKVGYAIEKKKLRLAVHTALVTNMIVDQNSTDNVSDSIIDQSVNVSGQLGAEVSYQVSPKTALSLGTTYGVSLNDLSNDSNVSAMSNNYMISMGIKYNII
ncbi:outer membrane beta-barrel protein [Flammeovirga sp. EKP202]|uniref:outer membrane beta-barrel protein n=1 Tax=Flammeovirga sp. EKP202 TaxID=2770592 RepID=UPI00165EC4C0|nr:outer membrane beta-barrel protein [Flammeovirga sp. EKP202]MBD0403385.1 outer membrane beta-barrel protein [Flammeovirga sp. EKP202]